MKFEEGQRIEGGKGNFMAKTGINKQQYDKFARLGLIGYEALFEAAASVLNVGTARKVLVCGSGSGQELITFAKLRTPAADVPASAATDAAAAASAAPAASYTLTGVDPSHTMVELCHERMGAELSAEQRSHIEVITGYVSDLSTGDERYRDYDAATCILVAHGLPDDDSPAGKRALLHSITQRLKPGAKLFLVDHTGDRTSPEYATMIDRWLDFVIARGIDGSGRARMREMQLGGAVHPMTVARTAELLASLHLLELDTIWQSFTIRAIVVTYRPPAAGATVAPAATASSSSSSSSSAAEAKA